MCIRSRLTACRPRRSEFAGNFCFVLGLAVARAPLASAPQDHFHTDPVAFANSVVNCVEAHIFHQSIEACLAEIMKMLKLAPIRIGITGVKQTPSRTII